MTATGVVYIIDHANHINQILKKNITLQVIEMEQPGELEDLFVGSVTLGERGQVVIPADARELMGLEAGDKLLAFCHPTKQMVCLCKLTMIERMRSFLSRLELEEKAEE
ncbi:MAG: AbrB/MazE/SpoVT family DNA-binding domain-containing protein [Armatimonadota bacterium]